MLRPLAPCIAVLALALGMAALPAAAAEAEAKGVLADKTRNATLKYGGPRRTPGSRRQAR